MRSAAPQRGISRIELYTVMGFLSVIGVGAFLVTRPSHAEESASLDKLALPLTEALSGWKNNHPNECPTLGLIEAEGLLEPGTRRDDPWGSRFRVACDNGGLSLLSSGPDAILGTSDDIRIRVD